MFSHLDRVLDFLQLQFGKILHSSLVFDDAEVLRQSLRIERDRGFFCWGRWGLVTACVCSMHNMPAADTLPTVDRSSIRFTSGLSKQHIVLNGGERRTASEKVTRSCTRGTQRNGRLDVSRDRGIETCSRFVCPSSCATCRACTARACCVCSSANRMQMHRVHLLSWHSTEFDQKKHSAASNEQLNTSLEYPSLL